MKMVNVEVERNVLKCLIQLKDYAASVFLYGNLVDDHFGDLFHRDSFSAIESFYKKFSIPPTPDKLKQHLLKFITYDTRFKSQENQRKIWVQNVDKLYHPINSVIMSGKDSDVDLLEELRKGRLLQKFLISSEESFSSGKYSDIITNMGEMINQTKKVDNIVMEGNIVEDFNQHVQLIKMKKSGLIKPVSTGIIGAIEDHETGEFKIVELDSFIDGGLYPGEMTLVIGENSVGKSFLLMEIPVNASMVNKQNSVIFTIEMNKIQEEMRIYSRITGIPFNKFRTGEITKKELIQVRDKLEWWKENCGILHVVSFDKGATSLDIENKLKSAEDKYGKEFHLVSIDYLNDMKPLGNFGNNKEWTAQGEISWDLTQLAKRWNNRLGIPIITASQKKTDRAGSGNTNWQDAAFSPLPAQHASVGLGISQDAVDIGLKRIRYDIWKDRYGKKSISFYTYPDFSISKINSLKKMYEVYDIDDEE